MKTKNLILSIAVIACVAGIILFTVSRSRNGSTGNARPSSMATLVAAEPNVERLEVTERPDQTVAAAAHVQAIRENYKKANDNLRAAIAAGERTTTEVEQGEREAAALERALLDSISSLTEQLARDPQMTTNAINLLAMEEDPEAMMMIAQAIGEAADSLGDKFPFDLLLEMAERDSSLARRQAALYALGFLSHIPAELQTRVAEISRSSPSVEMRTAAVVSMGSWMNRNRGLTQQISETLLQTREATEDPGVRGIVIQTIGNMDTPLSPKVQEAMADAVVNEPVPHNRSLAAVALGSGTGPQNRDEIVATLEHAYSVESTLDAQRHIITQITKASRYNAEDYLTRLDTPHPRLAQDVQDYIEILNSVDRNDWDKIWTMKSDRDHSRGTVPGGHGGHGTDEQ